MKAFNGFQKGVNLGGWLSQCGRNYTEEHYNSFIVKEDIAKIASWGVDHVRLPVDYNVIQNEDGTMKESGFSHIDRCLAWCEEYHLNVVFDLHKACGFVFDDKNYCDFFTDAKLQDQFIALWKEIATRYGSRKDIAFELLNEVTAFEMAKPWNEISARTIPEIRKIAPDVKIIVGGIYNSSIYGLSLMDKPADENVIFTFHCYSPMIFTHQNAQWIETMPKGYHCTFPQTAKETMEASHIAFGTDFDAEFDGLGDQVLDKEYFKKLFKPAIEISEKYDVILYCGEYGVIEQADTESTLKWYQEMHAALEECKIARAAWTYKAMNFGLTQDHVAEIYEDLIQLL